MTRLITLLAVIVVSEVALAFLFWVAARVFYKKLALDFKSIFKGLVERAFLLVALANGYAHAITFFSAVKLATRLKHDEKAEFQDRFNDYYLIGNLVSVMVAIGYTQLWLNFATVREFFDF